LKFIKNPRYGKITLFYLISHIFIVFLLYKFYVPCTTEIRKDSIENISYTSFEEKQKNNEIEIAYYQKMEDYVYLKLSNGIYVSITNPNYEEFKKDLLENDILVEDISKITFAEQVEESRKSNTFLIVFGFGIISIYLLFKTCSESEDKITIIKNKKRVSAGSGVTTSVSTEKSINNKNVNVKMFEDVAGLSEVKKDMKCLVDFLVNAEKYKEAGATLPRGVILYGPPGTGKTLLAKAVAGEANVPFLYMSGSEFIELYVGVGAKRVRELFQKARRQAPCIVFIDEIDAIGGKRNSRDASGEDRKTINALLTEMDGFKETENILVIAATNRIEDLDEALTRPGRFTNKYCVPLPETASERLEIINLYVQDKKLDETVDLTALSKELIGFSPAKIEALLNEAAIISVQDNSPYITKEIIDKAMYKLLLQGHMKEDNSERDKEELELVAWHEAGHAVIGHVFGKDVTKVTIVSSTSGAGGVTFSTPTKTHLLSVDDMKNEVMELYGGRLAEYIFYKENASKITTGASNDIERATNIIHELVTRYGMSKEFGMLNLEAAKMDNNRILACEIKLAKELEKKTFEMLQKYKKQLESIAKLLIEQETIYTKDIQDIFTNVA